MIICLDNCAITWNACFLYAICFSIYVIQFGKCYHQLGSLFPMSLFPLYLINGQSFSAMEMPKKKRGKKSPSATNADFSLSPWVAGGMYRVLRQLLCYYLGSSTVSVASAEFKQRTRRRAMQNEAWDAPHMARSTYVVLHTVTLMQSYCYQTWRGECECVLSCCSMHNAVAFLSCHI